MTSFYLTRNAFLKCMALIYLVAFISIYTQIPGLYGRDGLLPAHTQLPTVAELSSSGNSADVWQRIWQHWLDRPTLLVLVRHVAAVDTQHALDIVALSGACVAILAVMFEMCRTSVVYLLLLLLYMSIVQVGQVFMSFQWDTLLLETGLLCVILAPLFPWQPKQQQRKQKKLRVQPTPVCGYHDNWDTMGMWLVRWLLFRLMFSAGVVKLQSGCPTWWKLTALEVHFESQCVPTALAWFCHHLPVWLLRVSTAASLYIECIVPFLFFAPIKQLRQLAFTLQVFLQLMIIISGNYNFFNILAIVLCVSLLDDSSFSSGRKSPENGICRRVATTLTLLVSCAALVYLAVVLFDLHVTSASSGAASGGVAARVSFSRDQFDRFLAASVPVSVVLAAASLLCTAVHTLYTTVLSGSGCCRRFTSLLHWILAVSTCALMFSLSLAPYTAPLDSTTFRQLPPPLAQVHTRPPLQHAALFNSYGLFRRMTGVGGRPEVVLEGSDHVTGPWSEIEFMYKPGHLYRPPPFIIPHQPRLDWQMWFAALGTYHDNAWLVSLAHRILTAQPQVISLLQFDRHRFGHAVPKYIRAVKYLYHYSDLNTKTGAWWRRDGREEYMPIYSADHKPLLDYLTKQKIIGVNEPTSRDTWLVKLLDGVRSVVEGSTVRTELLIWSVLVALLVIHRSTSRLPLLR